MKKYWKTFSSREILSAVFSSMLIVGFFTFGARTGLLRREFAIIGVFLIVAAPLVASHRIYLIEHKRRNRFLGRLTQNLMTAVLTAILAICIFSIGGTLYKIGRLPDIFMLSLMGIFVVEILLTVVNRIFLLIGWRTW